MVNYLLSSRGNFPSTLNITRRNTPLVKSEVKSTAIHDSIFDIVGKTPLLKLNKPDKLLKHIDPYVKKQSIKCNIIVKLEYLNPGGSIKDRIGKSMVDDAIKSGHLADKWLMEPSSGNTGIAIAMNSSVRRDFDGHHNGCCIVTREKCSDEKLCIMRLLGTKIVLLKNHDNEIGTVDKAMAEFPDRVVVLDQFNNQVNPQTHYEQTAEEIYEAFDKKWPDMIVMGVGSGGTFTGIATRVKNEGSNCKIVHADPSGSELHPNPYPHSFLVEGLAGTDIPFNLDISLRDEYQTVTDKEAFLTAKTLARHEGILCGGSSGLAVAAAIKAIVTNGDINVSGKNVVVILPDGIRNYMTKFVQDQWMEAHLFQPIPDLKVDWYNYLISNKMDDMFVNVLKQHKPLKVKNSTSGKEAFKMIIKYDYDVAAIIYDEHGPCYQDYGFPMVGLVSANSMRYHLTNPRVMPEDLLIYGTSPDDEPVTQFMEKDVYVLKIPAPHSHEDGPQVGLLARMLDITQYVVLGFEHVDTDGKSYFYGNFIATAVDILHFMRKPVLPNNYYVRLNV